MESIPLWLPFLFFIVALLYSTVGFGGGSSYLALLVLAGLSYTIIPQTALACNLVVSAGGVWHFSRAGYVDLRRMAPLLVFSIPMAYIGGRIDLSREVFMVLLGVSLLAAGARLLVPGWQRPLRSVSRREEMVIGGAMGAGLGLLSGMVGIGGGIFLAPLLLVMGWANAKQAAATAAVFILMNSAAGLAGQVSKGMFVSDTILPLVVAVWLGGQIGSRLGAFRLPMLRVRQLLASLIIFVSLRLLWGAF